MHQKARSELQKVDVSSPQGLQDYMTYLNDMYNEGTHWCILFKHRHAVRARVIFWVGYKGRTISKVMRGWGEGGGGG